MPGALKLNADLTGVRTFRQRSEFITSVPIDSLVAFFDSHKQITLDVDSKVSGWTGFGGRIAANSNADRRPSMNSQRVSFNGSDDYLVTTIAPPTQGYMVWRGILREIPASPAAVQVICGSAGGGSTVCAMAISIDQKLAGNIGDRTASNFKATTVFTDESTHTLGLRWDATTAYLRVDGVEEASAVYTGSGGAVGSTPLALGARASAFTFPTEMDVRGWAIYSGAISSLYADEIDTAVTALG